MEPYIDFDLKIFDIKDCWGSIQINLITFDFLKLSPALLGFSPSLHKFIDLVLDLIHLYLDLLRINLLFL